jgi:excisionase family DNA binding protein
MTPVLANGCTQVMPQELFPKVELWQLSEHVARALKEIVRDALVEHGTVERTPVGGMRAAEAAAYLGVGRSTFYKLVKTEPALQRSYVIGTARLWRKEDLDAWIQAQVAP